MTILLCIFSHAHPGSPYVFGLVEDDRDVDFPEPMPVVGTSISNLLRQTEFQLSLFLMLKLNFSYFLLSSRNFPVSKGLLHYFGVGNYEDFFYRRWSY